jgi:hypothetical protein
MQRRQTRLERLQVRTELLVARPPASTIDLARVPRAVAEMFADILARAERDGVAALTDDDLDHFVIIEALARTDEPKRADIILPAWVNETWPAALRDAYRDRHPEARPTGDSDQIAEEPAA